MTFADKIFHGGPIITMDSARPDARCVAVKGSKIVEVGSSDEILQSLRGPDTEIIDLAGKVLMPGFVEAHGHPLWSGLVWGDPVIDIRALHTPSYDAAMAKIRRRVAKAEPGEFIFATGLDSTLHEGMHEPTLQELNELAPDNPLAICLFNFHAMYLNSAAARACGFEHGAEGMLDQQIVRDPASGRPWKFLEETAEAVRDRFFEVCGKDRALRELGEWTWKYARAGYTTTSEIGILPQWSGYLEALIRQGTPPVRIRGYERAFLDTPFSPSLGKGDDHFKMIGVKIWADGSVFVGNVAVTRPYLTNEMTIKRMGMPEGNTGHTNFSRAELLRMMEAAIAGGWQLSVHTQGDATIDVVLDCFEEILNRHEVTNGPCRLEHCTLMRADQVKRAHSLGLVCSFFNGIVYYWGTPLANDMFGSERGENMLPFGAAVECGMRISFHCDSPMTWPDPIMCMDFGVNRRTKNGTVLGSHQRIPVEAALRAVTIDAAYHVQMEDRVGSIEPGKLADFVVLDQDPRAMPAERLGELKVLGTYLGGEAMWAGEENA